MRHSKYTRFHLCKMGFHKYRLLHHSCEMSSDEKEEKLHASRNANRKPSNVMLMNCCEAVLAIRELEQLKV